MGGMGGMGMGGMGGMGMGGMGSMGMGGGMFAKNLFGAAGAAKPAGSMFGAAPANPSSTSDEKK